ncbi:hypothetical protein SAMN05660845_1897 [Flavobacterium swingsii]|uniref:Carboxypeptidase-like regulatory domain-containing protein n=1 Tax=Flavobacterium swingsii TaxID=498292 RepID=A0A1I0YQE9_9FLAO|nr:DUF5686 family protein [Flavobacterium swingsii]SFB15605.1 hypothetical protein SAMN05660845_1897 [Flavobacterium swingsii]
MVSKRQLSYICFFILLFVNIKTIAQENSFTGDTIIKKVILYKPVNNSKNYEFTAYNKLIITANPDLIEGRIDSVFVSKRKKKVLSKIDSSDYFFKKIIAKQHLYQTEKISKFQVVNNHRKERILATKMAGFKEPIFEYFALQLQPFSVYDNKYSLVEKEYTSPISDKGTRKYNYTFLETTVLDGRKAYKVLFQPKQKSKTDQLEGVLFIDAKKYSIAKIELKVSGLVQIKFNHYFQYDKELGNWFPTKSNLSIKKGNSKAPIKILGETITFEGNDSKLNPKGKKYASDFVEIKSNTTYFEPRFNETPKIKNPDIAITISENAISKKEPLWYNYFNDSTDVRSSTTYFSLDSLIQKRKYENKIKIGRKVLKGYYPVGFFDVDLRYIFSYNNYEGFRLGLGGVTNEKLSKNYKLEGYYVYGTKDGFFKGYVANSFRVDNRSETWLGFSYKDDVNEIASTSFEVDKRTFKIYDPRPFNISTFYNHVTWRGFVETKIIPKTESIWQISQSDIIPRFDYLYKLNDNLYNDFKTTLLTVSLQWNPFSKYMQTPNKTIEIDKNYPKFTFQFSKTISKLGQNDFDFGKVDFRFDYQKKFNSNHKLMFLMEGGYAFGDIPITHVYNHSPNNLTKDKIIQRITFAGRDSFETMYYNEFFSNKYAFFQLEHQFPKFEISKKIKPVFSLVTKYGIGSLQNLDRHLNLNFKTLEKGYMESGFELNQIYQGLGFVAFYRYGQNQLPDFEDNIAVKLSIKIDLGF